MVSQNQQSAIFWHTFEAVGSDSVVGIVTNQRAGEGTNSNLDCEP